MSLLTPHGLKPLWLSVWFALGFVAIRVTYRVAFGGAHGVGDVVWDIPAVRLPAPLTTVSVGGTVTVDGIVIAAQSAVPFAAVIVAFGIIGTIVDVRTLLVRVRPRGLGRAIVTAAGIAVTTVPVLGSAITRVRESGRWRGMRPGMWMLAPILSWTVEHALVVAGALEARGFGRSLNAPAGVCEFPIEARDVRLAIGERTIVRIPTLSCESGSVTVVTGDTGSGKTTLLRAIVGLFQHLDGGGQTGTLLVGAANRAEVPPRDTAHFVSFVPQNPRTAFLTPSVRDELQSATDLCAGDRDAAHFRAASITRELGIDHLIARPIEHLSAGEATVVAIAVALVSQPTVLVLDEPLADLDLDSRARVLGVLTRIARGTDIALVVAEHRTASLASFATQVVRLSGGTATVGGTELIADTCDEASAVVRRDSGAVGSTASRVTAVWGPNGVGKTTLLRSMAHVSTSAFVPERPADILLTDSVSAECRRNDRVRGLVRGTTQARLESLSSTVAHSTSHPHDLSAGEQLLLAVAMQSAHGPELLLVDAPTRGLDPESRRNVAAALTSCAPSGNVIIATHDAEFTALLAATIVPMTEPGQVTPDHFVHIGVPR